MLLLCLTYCKWMKVANLRQRFYHSIAPGGLAGDRRGVVPASGFSFSAQQIWQVIKENRDLDLPAHKVNDLTSCIQMYDVTIVTFMITHGSSFFQVMVATVRCEEIANERYSDFTQNQVQFFILNNYFDPLINMRSFVDGLCFRAALLSSSGYFFLLLQDWLQLEEASQSGPVAGFGKKLSSIIGNCLSE